MLTSPDPLQALQRLARAWRRELGCRVVGITGSTGKTSVKDIARSILPLRVHASPENYNTEIGLPLTILSAPPETEALVLEMAMRGLGQIAELCEIAEPDVAAITNVGPVHLELLGTLEAIAEAKAEILAGLRRGGTAVVPVDAEALEPHLHDTLETHHLRPRRGGRRPRRDASATDACRRRLPRRAARRRLTCPSARPTTSRTRSARSGSASLSGATWPTWRVGRRG